MTESVICPPDDEFDAVVCTPAVQLGWIAKAGRDIGENDDRAAAGLYRFAVADGAATSARPEVWAEILVHAFVGAGLNPFEPAALTYLRGLWQSEVYRANLPWHATAKLRQGGAAAFVGLEIDPHRAHFEAWAVGDACVLHLRDDQLLHVGPIDRSERFSRFPVLVTTVAGDQAHCAGVWHAEGSYRSGDRFLLASDALAKYLLRRYERGGSLAVASEFARNFAEWVDRARRQEDLDNDDTTVCVVAV
ncbi:hypothetical protein [Nocardia otitidiscaviarum]|uniref:hypothetical protein n=1 Tax=Nocardia otitidiscaviarum TaxID=1823 RepID=UPI002453A977|nr:hypothetical protein [Nocardia otitidiscaviarum]